MEESEKRKERLKAMSIEAEVSNDVEASAMPGFESIDRDCRMTLVELRVLTIIPTLWQHFLLTRRWATVIIRLWKGNNLLHLQLCIHRSSLVHSFLLILIYYTFAYLFWFGGIRDFNRYLPLHQMQTHFSPVQGVYNLGPYNPRITRPSLMRRGQSDSWNGSQASDNHNIVSDGTPRGMFEGSPGFNNGTVNPRTFGNSLILDRGPRGIHVGRSLAAFKTIPWRRQEAGVDGLSTPGTSNSWLPKSIATKMAKVSEASSNKFSSQQSLAEYLAASFNKAV
ncbi:protein SICKLE-like [Hibiscus syriacus]|uniref:protein SICKLE-like n=1 Tax=Hibiscus syriacus TaxID=106335 RepID=UPI0019247B7A|nr:protein SICKLE-like [Hibiscus syriacus]